MNERNRAALAGKTYYHDGKRCRNGHDSPRFVADGRCVECVRQKRNRWKARYPDMAAAKLHRHLVRLGERRKGPMV